MKRAFQQTASWVILLALAVTQVSVAQQPEYHLEQLPIPDGWFVNDFNNQGFVVGHSRFTDGETVVLYDHLGVLGTAGKTWSLDELIALPAVYASVSILDINNLGQFVAYLNPADGPRDSILVNLMDTNGDVLVDSAGDPAPTWMYLNVPVSSISYASQINDSGQVLGSFKDDSSGESYAFMLDSSVSNAIPEVLTDPYSTQPIPITQTRFLRLNNLGQVAGSISTGETSGGYNVTQGFRVTPGVEIVRTPLDETIRTMLFRDMNDLGQLVGWSQLAVTSSGSEPETTFTWGAVRYDELTGYDLDLLSTTNALAWQSTTQAMCSALSGRSMAHASRSFSSTIRTCCFWMTW